jgi:hypothetical protein
MIDQTCYYFDGGFISEIELLFLKIKKKKRMFSISSWAYKKNITSDLNNSLSTYDDWCSVL